MARERLPGRLAVVFINQLPAGLLDNDRCQRHRLFCRFDGDCHHPLAERMARGAFCPTAADTSSCCLRVEPYGQCAAARSVHAHARSAAVAPGHRRRCRLFRSAGGSGRSRQLGRIPEVFLSRTLWCRRPALQQGHQFLSLRTACLHRHQDLDAAHRRSERAFRRNDLLGARRHPIRYSPPIDVADSNCSSSR